MAELNRLVGEAVRRTTSDEALERLARVYWFTVEFGVLREAGEIKAYGAGLVSSAGELEAMLRAELRPLDLEAASRQEFGTTEYQPVLFCADSFESMYQNLRDTSYAGAEREAIYFLLSARREAIYFLRKRAMPCWQSSVMRAMALRSAPDWSAASNVMPSM
jgi:phenylalanine-4-hydroxylase